MCVPLRVQGHVRPGHATPGRVLAGLAGSRRAPAGQVVGASRSHCQRLARWWRRLDHDSVESVENSRPKRPNEALPGTKPSTGFVCQTSVQESQGGAGRSEPEVSEGPGAFPPLPPP
jgi:hypothetical protein